MKTKFSVADFQKWKAEGRLINMLNCYDHMWARIMDVTDIPLILVGDSLGMCILGYSGTTPVTMDEMIMHTKAVVKGAPHTFVVGDMPFGSYNISRDEAVRNANRFMKETGCDCIKLEGGVEMADKIEAIVKAGIPVMGHLGLTPQTAAALGGFKTQGKSLAGAKKLIEDAKAVEAAGASATLIETVPNVVADAMIRSISIPVIGLGAGQHCHGYGIAVQDMLVMDPIKSMKPKFCRVYAHVGQQVVDIINRFYEDCSGGSYPSLDECYNVTEFDYSVEDLLKA